jgi:hypothetical protein
MALKYPLVLGAATIFSSQVGALVLALREALEVVMNSTARPRLRGSLCSRYLEVPTCGNAKAT